MHSFIRTCAQWADYCPPSARVYCEDCSIEACGYAGTEDSDYDVLMDELVARYTDDCAIAENIVLIEHVMSA